MISSEFKNSLVEIGRIGKPHGIHGGVTVFIYNPKCDLNAYMDKLLVKTPEFVKPAKTISCAPSRNGYIFFFEGIDTRDKADSMRGFKLCVRREDLPDLDSDEFYIQDLIGLRVLVQDEEVGRITFSRSLGDVEVITVENDKEQFEIPLVEDFVIKIDFKNNYILLNLPEGLPRAQIK